MLEKLNLRPDVLDAYPHEISGGMKQRVMIAFSMLLNPEVIILDEPTTALDVITQSYIFSLLKQIIISHQNYCLKNYRYYITINL